MEWLFFALAAPFLWAIGSTIVKFMRVKYIKNPLSYLIFTSPVIFLSLILLFFEPFKNPGLTNTIICIITGIMAVLGYYFFIYALHKEEVSRVITLYGITPLFVLLLAAIFLNEMLSPKDYAAFFLILAGTYLISRKEENKLKISKGLLVIILSSFVWAVHNLLLKVASDTNFTTMAILRELGILITVLLILIFSKSAWKKTKEIAKQFKIRGGFLAYTAESVGFAGMVFAYLAIQRASVSLVTLVEGFQSLFIIILAIFLSLFFPKIIKEVIDKKTITIKIISALLMLSGLYIITV